MISVDTNILLYSVNSTAPEHARARDFIEALGALSEVVMCELVLVELYLLLRNPAVLARPLTAPVAAAMCQGFRNNPRWRLVDSAPIMAQLWELAAQPGLPRRRVIDLRLALTLRHHGVTELATRNLADFKGLGFQRVWDPLAEG